MLLDEISGSHGGEYEDVFWDVAPCSLVEVYRRFIGACCHHLVLSLNVRGAVTPIPHASSWCGA
jgi:hypothetical protein